MKSLFYALVAGSSVYGATLKDLPTCKVGKWTSEFVYFYPGQTVEVKTDLKISHSDDGKHLVIGAYSKSDAFGEAAFSYYADLIPNEEGKYPYQFMSTTGQKEAGTIEVIDLLTTKQTFTVSSGYSISKSEIISETLVIGEEKTYDSDGKLLFRATFRNEWLSSL